MGKIMRYQIADYINVGKDNEEYALMGAGFSALNEATGAKSETTTYINDKASSSYVKGYETSFDFDTELILEEAATAKIYDVSRNQKVGTEAETEYIRVELFKPTEDEDTYCARKFRVSIEVSDITGEGASAVKLSGGLRVLGDFTDGTFNTQTRVFTPCA